MSAFTGQELGYRFYPPADPHDLGHPQLDVVIHATPTSEHFDPERFLCLIAAPDGSTPLHVLHPWTQERTYRVCAGDAIIEDREHEQMKAFTFGGTLSIESDYRGTVCRLTSPVSLLEYSPQPTALGQQLIDEVNILFAERRATQDEDAFAQRLAAAEPVQLYHACLIALSAKFEHFPTLDEPHRRFKQFLHNATQSFSADVTPSLAELL
jgi:hypothetical protein